MSLNKAIKFKKEKRREYTGGKAVDRHCENHGGRRHQWECLYCKDNRTYKDRQKDKAAKEEIKKSKIV